MGLSADPRGPDEPRAPRCPLDHRHHSARRGNWACTGAPTSWRTFLAAHWGAIAAADFFTTEVWTARGLVTYYTLFVIDLGSRRLHIVGSTPHPDEAYVLQVARAATDADDGCLRASRFLICDRDTKWSLAVRQTPAAAGIRVVHTPYAAPNRNAYAERFIRSVKEECLNRLVILGASPSHACRLRGTLSSGAESSGPAGQADHANAGRAAARPRPLLPATRRAASVLLSGRLIARFEFPDNTAAAETLWPPTSRP